MSHLDIERLERFLHGELDPGDETRAPQHIATCVQCAERVRETAREEAHLFALLGELDHPVPAEDLDAILRRAPRSRRSQGLIAAGIVLLLVAGGLVYALPGSPFRAWVDGLGAGPDGDRTAPAEVTSEGTGASVSGIAVEPGDAFDIVFGGRQVEGRIRVTVVDSEALELRTLGSPVPVSSEPMRLVISNPSASRASYEIRIPETAPYVRVLVGDRTVLVKIGADLHAPAKPSATGWVEIPLDTGRP